jgi:hypothetical protein
VQAGSGGADNRLVPSATRWTVLLVTALLLCWSAPLARGDARGDCAGADATYSGSNLAALRATVICLTNRERVARGMAPLNEESHLDAAAQGHSEDMATNNYFDHTDLSGGKPWDRTKAAGYPSGWIGENIAAGYGSPFLVMTGWMKSSGHCANILNSPYVDIGIGISKKSGSRYGTYWTMVLGGHSSSAAVVTVNCPYSSLVDGNVPVANAPTPESPPTPAATVSSVKRLHGGRYRVKGTISPSSTGTRVSLTVKRGKKTRKYSVKTGALGAFSKTVRAPSGKGQVRVTAKL